MSDDVDDESEKLRREYNRVLSSLAEDVPSQAPLHVPDNLEGNVVRMRRPLNVKSVFGRERSVDEVFASAQREKLKHVVVLGVDENEGVFIETNETCDIQTLCWLLFTYQHALGRIV